MSRKFIFTIQFILVCILCIGCNTNSGTPNKKEADLIYLPSNSVSIDGNLIVTLTIEDSIHIITATYYNLLSYELTSDDKDFYFCDMPQKRNNNSCEFEIDGMGIGVTDNSCYFYLIYYCYENTFYIVLKELDCNLFSTIYSKFLINLEKQKVVGARQCKLFKAIFREPRATVDEIVNILEEEL